jgi:metal-responsive CopG/Arc/MetJ family transcriptional regulator
MSDDVVAVRMPRELAHRVDVAARDELRSRTAQVQHLIEQALAERSRQDPKDAE